jgi:dihydroorotate dehydrogenase
MTLYIAAPFGNYIKTANIRSVVGSFTVEKRTGLLKQIATTLRYHDGVWYNAIGLRNPGIEYGLRRYNESTGDILSVAAIKSGDWEILNNIIPFNTDIELNLSCPNIEHFDDYNQGIDKFLNGDRKVIAKLSPLTTKETIVSLINQGFDSFHCCNTLPTEKGGMSGKGLYVHIERLIRIIKYFKKDADIIAGGGIENIEDIRKYNKLGATSFSLGTVCFNLFKLFNVIKEYKKSNLD